MEGEMKGGVQEWFYKVAKNNLIHLWWYLSHDLKIQFTQITKNIFHLLWYLAVQMLAVVQFWFNGFFELNANVRMLQWQC